MLLSFSLIFILGILSGVVFDKIHLPKLLGMIITGIIIGPYVLNLLDNSILSISADLRQIALIIIITRAGLNLDLSDLKKVGHSAILMCFIPAVFEIIGMVILAPILFDVSLIDAAIMGSVVAAVSPAVVVPRMLKLIEESYGTKKGIPQLIMASSSVDDVFVIALFSIFTGLGDNLVVLNLIKIPILIILGIFIGIITGILLSMLFSKFCISDSIKVIIILSISFIFVTIEHSLKGLVNFSGLIAIMSMSIMLKRKLNTVASKLSLEYSKLWIPAELLLFVLVGAAVDIKYALSSVFYSVILIFGVLVFRIFGVFVCLIGTKLNKNEKLFCMISYCPKATVQAAIGSVPLSMGLECGNIVLTVAVLAILITAPIGAFLIDLTYKKFLKRY